MSSKAWEQPKSEISGPGSSAIITATLLALMKFYQVKIPLEILPNVTLSVEVDKLGIYYSDDMLTRLIMEMKKLH